MGGRSILVIDDEADVQEIARLSLQITRQWQVLSASSGREGVAIAVASQPDAILLDIKMPDMDGPATLKQLLTNPATQHIPVIFLTAKLMPARQDQKAGLNAKAIFVKPFDPGTLADQIETALGWRG
jgi:CheY-like chemotaxis protein